MTAVGRFKYRSSYNNTHGESPTKRRGYKGSPEYSSWRNMIHRCYYPGAVNWKWYGGRGVQVCERWRNSYTDFLADMGRKPGKSYSLDRWPDRKGNYEPGNVRWASKSEQCANRDDSRKIATTCRNGIHPITPENTYTCASGHEQCKPCLKAARRQLKEIAKVKRLLRKLPESCQIFMNEDSGKDLVEYALLCLLVALGCVAGMSVLAGSINAEMSRIAGSLT